MNPRLVVSLCPFSQAAQIINDYRLFHRMLWWVVMKEFGDFISH